MRPQPMRPHTARPLSRRELIIEVSRRKYGRPRAEVERMVAEQLGYAQPLSTAPVFLPSSATAGNAANSRQLHVGDELKGRLLEVGIEADRADSLLTHFAREAIKRQLEWLPYRDARNPAAFLIAAIEHDYEPPLALRQAPEHQAPEHQEPRPQEPKYQDQRRANR